jgi:hypothetical protein
MKREDGPGKGLNMLLLHQLVRPNMTGGPFLQLL